MKKLYKYKKKKCLSKMEENNWKLVEQGMRRKMEKKLDQLYTVALNGRLYEFMSTIEECNIIKRELFPYIDLEEKNKYLERIKTIFDGFSRSKGYWVYEKD